MVGSEQGKIFYYKNIDGNLEGEFEENDSLYLIIGNQPFEIKNGIRTGAAIKDLNSDGFFDLLVGNYSGGLNYYSGTDSPPVIGLPERMQSPINLTLLPNPVKENLMIKIQTNCLYYRFEINIFNMLSELVLSKTFIAGEEMLLSVNTLPSGIYLCKVELFPSGTGEIYQKLIICR